MRLPQLASLVAAALFIASARGQQTDAAAPDIAALLQALKAIKEQQILAVKSSKQRILQQAQAAAASPAAAAAAWAEAIKQTQIEGVEKEGAQLRAWREGDGAAFSEKEVQAASQLYFRWLVLTMQRSLGAQPRELLPAVVQFTKDVAADHAAMEAQGEKTAKEKEIAQSRLHGLRKDKTGDDERARKVHDQILNRGLAGSAPVQALNAEDLVRAEKWELTPGNIDGIFTSIVLPELRLAKDPRIFEYWDMRIKKETEAVREKPSFEQENFAKERRPVLLWSRAQEYLALGQRNRGIGELFQILRAYPQHQSVPEWITQIEALLVPPPAASGS